MGVFKSASDWVEIAKDSSLILTKRKNAILKIKDLTRLLELASRFSKGEDAQNGMLQLIAIDYARGYFEV